MKEADWYEQLESKVVRCLLCPHNCLLSPGKTGICRVRTNFDGVLYSEIYGWVSALHIDPIEKKPLFHFYPGSKILSIGSVGCNLRCRFCQNCEISQRSIRESDSIQSFSAADIVNRIRGDSIGVAYTYNEPSIWIEFITDIATMAKEQGYKNVLVTNGYINENPLLRMIEYIDAFSVDLKAFTEQFYQKITSSHLHPVLKSLELIRKKGKHLEIVNLVIPGLNDQKDKFEEMVEWIAATLGNDTVLHLSAYYPTYLAKEPPTPASTLLQLKEIASRYLTYVYTGNLLAEENDTFCPDCKNLLVRRRVYETQIIGIQHGGKCKHCGKLIFQNY